MQSEYGIYSQLQMGSLLEILDQTLLLKSQQKTEFISYKILTKRKEILKHGFAFTEFLISENLEFLGQTKNQGFTLLPSTTQVQAPLPDYWPAGRPSDEIRPTQTLTLPRSRGFSLVSAAARSREAVRSRAQLGVAARWREV